MSLEKLLQEIKVKIETITNLDDKYLVSKGNHNGFEYLVIDVLTELKENSSTNFEFTAHLGHHFPDISIFINSIKYGLELKSVKNGSWRVNGNSVFESVTSEGYEEIYLLFGSKVKNENSLKVKYAHYWQAISDIKVTHSPRFFVNLTDIDSVPNTLFQSKEEYQSLQQLSEKEKIRYIQDKLSIITTGNKWYVAQEESAPVTFFKDLSTEDKSKIRSECFLIFPVDLLLNKNANYDHAAKYILETYFVTHTSFRDTFTAGGKSLFCSAYDSPRILSHFEESIHLITSYFEDLNEDFSSVVLSYWKKQIDDYSIDLNITHFNIDSYKEILKWISQNTFHKDVIRRSNVNSLDDLFIN